MRLLMTMRGFLTANIERLNKQIILKIKAKIEK